MQMLLKLARKGENPVFVNNTQEFLSVWSIAHAWENLLPDSTAPNDIPASIQGNIDSLLLGFMRDELSLRRSFGYRVLGHTFLQTLFGLDKDFQLISNQLYRKTHLDKSLLNDLYVKRSDLIRWCETEFRVPPNCWSPQTTLATDRRSGEGNDEPEDDGWLSQITERRKTIIACLEVAKNLWQQNPRLSYEEVHNHPLLVQTGLRRIFSLDSFKKWTRNIAPEEAKRGGRRPQSTA